MSLYRQLWISIVACTAIAFLISLGISAVGARSYLERQLTIKNADAARALALSMSQLPKDAATLKLQLLTLFEEGQYEVVRLSNSEGKVLFEKGERAGHPISWIASLLPIIPESGSAEISDGPTHFGRVELASIRDVAYVQLQTIAVQLLAGFLAAGALTGLLASLVLKRIRGPLAEVTAQANAIAERRFVTLNEPQTPELRSVVRAMNLMVSRLRAMFAEEAARLEQARRAANHDALTGLANREYFFNQFAGMLDIEADSSGGVLLVLRLRDLTELNRRSGRLAADALLRRTGEVLQNFQSNNAHIIIGRLNGADFALAVQANGESRSQTSMLAQQVRQAMLEAGVIMMADAVEVFSIAATSYLAGDRVSSVLARTDAVLAQAESKTDNAFVVAEPGGQSDLEPAAAWQEKLASAIGARRISMVRFPSCHLSGELLHQECFVRLDLNGDGEWLPASRFMPLVRRRGLNAQFDLIVANTVLQQAARGEPLALNISAESLHDKGFTDALLSTLDASPSALPWLSVEIPDDAALRYADTFAHLVQELKSRGCKVGIERFGRHFGNIGALHALGLDYIKIDASFVRGIEHSRGNQQFLKGVCAILHELGCTVIADGVQTENELHSLSSLGFDAATGPAVC